MQKVFKAYKIVFICRVSYIFLMWLPKPGFCQCTPTTIYIYMTERKSCIIYNKPTRCNSGNIVFINNYKYALHVPDVLCVHHQEHYKLQQQPLVFVMSWDGINPV